MKFAACADLHLTDKIPENRKAGYLSQICNKLGQILELTEKHTNTGILMVAGDFFDSPRIPYFIPTKIINILMDTTVEIFAVPGQHDIRYHRVGLENTPLGVLASSRLVEILSSEKAIEIEGVTFIGSGWNETPKDKADCVLMHQTITKVDPLYPGDDETSNAAQVLNRHKWAKCIISGDNHKMFTYKNKRQLLVNCGSMVRSAKDQIEHVPHIHIIDTGKTPWGVKSIPLDVLPPEMVFDFNKIEKQERNEEEKKKKEEEIGDLVNMLSKTDMERPEFVSILQKIVEKIKPNNEVEFLINDIMEEAQSGKID